MPRIFMPIAAAFAPNYTLREVLLAGSYLMPWRRGNLQQGDKAAKLEEDFAGYMRVERAVSFESGRAGFFAILKALDIQAGDEVILQAFTTVALPNTIRLVGARPVFCDIDPRTYDMDPEKLEPLITPRTKALVIQHTFGNPADLQRLLALARKHNLKTIEDCAHSLGAKYQDAKTGRLADAAFFSFGRDKVISAVTGGMVIAKDALVLDRVKALRDTLPYPSNSEIRRYLRHPVITFTALHTYNLLGIGCLIMFLCSKGKLLDRAYSKREKRSEPDAGFARRMPDALAALALSQMRRIGRFNRIRIRASERYAKLITNPAVGKPSTTPGGRNIFLWYTVTVKDKYRLIREAKRRGLILGDWFPQAIGPADVDPAKSGYRMGSCPNAEALAAHCVNLPTHHNIHRREAQRVIDFLNECA